MKSPVIKLNEVPGQGALRSDERLYSAGHFEKQQGKCFL